eukprot:TRINITY_DN2896_c0_g1_i1.p1 TRINITY_DN2896_c0_g1~~TRINITY_DN2896_c0_g1_i1.p1  ORF type:complete len:1287 (-),score=349.97 TRINITY_DN2896_c0_g1_i1:26-3886(-)
MFKKEKSVSLIFSNTEYTFSFDKDLEAYVDENTIIRYKGDVKKKLADGKGLYYSKLGNLEYNGEWKNGRSHGIASFFHDNGEKLSEGTMENGLYQGITKFYFPNGKLKSEIQLDMGKKNGPGKLFNDKGVLIFEGIWKNNKKEGFGKTYDNEGRLIYEGNYSDEYEHGKGIRYHLNGKIKFSGTFKTGKKHGKGFSYHDTGVIEHEGIWNNDKKHAKGKLYDKSGILYFDGFFGEDLMHGKGIMYSTSGKILYDGEFNNNVFEGKGKLYFDTETLDYEGNFVSGYRNGYGIGYHKNGKILFKGEWRGNKPHGFGVIYKDDGKILQEGFFEYGTLTDGRDMSKPNPEIGDIVVKMELRGTPIKEKFWVTYIKNKEHSVESAWLAVRMMIIGCPNVGKTTITKRLVQMGMGSSFFKAWLLKPPKDDITHGVEIYEWIEPNTRTQFVLWDFAGHTEYHGTHQFFIQPKCIYLLLMDLSRKDIMLDNQVRYWIQFLHSRTGGDFRLILIGTHTDKIKVNKDQILENANNKIGELLEELQIKEVVHIFKDEESNKERWFFSLCANSLRAERLGKLRSVLIKLYSQVRGMKLTSVHEQVLKFIREISAKSNSPFLRFDTLMNEFKTYSVERNEMSAILVDLCNLGTLIYVDDEILSNIIITDVKWLNSVFKQLVSLKSFSEEKYIVEWSELWILIRENTFQDWIKISEGDKTSEFIRSLLMKFDLLMPLERVTTQTHGNIKYLVPLLFNKNKGESIPIVYKESKEKIEKNRVNERTYFLPFSPPSTLKRVFLRIRQILQNKLGQTLFREYFWATGILMEFGTFSIEISFTEMTDKSSTKCDLKFRVESSNDEKDYILIFHDEIIDFFKIWFPNLVILFENKTMGKDSSIRTNEENEHLLSEHPLIGQQVVCNYCLTKNASLGRCDKCDHPVLFDNKIALIYQIMTNSTQATLWKAYDLKEKVIIALKDMKNNDYVSKTLFFREIKVTKQLSEICYKNEQCTMLYKSISKMVYCKQDHSCFGLEWVDSSYSSLDEINFGANKNFNLYLLIASVLSVLTVLHDNFLIHQDLNPPNILFSEKEKSFILIDFGTIVREDFVTTDDKDFISYGKEKTFHLVPPEQIAATPVRSSDLYSLGMMVKDLIRTQKLEIDGFVSQILEKMTQKDLSLRYFSARDVLKDFSEICHKEIQINEIPVESIDIMKNNLQLQEFQRRPTLQETNKKPTRTFELDPCPNCQFLTVMANYCMHCGVPLNKIKFVRNSTGALSKCVHCETPISSGLACVKCVPVQNKENK